MSATNYTMRLIREALTFPGDTGGAMLDQAKLIYLASQERQILGFDKAKTLQALGVTEVPYDMNHSSGVHGWSTKDELAVTRATRYPTRILWHELGHILCEHPERKEAGTISEELGEYEAEMVAYLLANYYNYNESKAESRAYIQGWNKAELVLDTKSLGYIREAANKIVKVNL
jgi:hypothetical protein